MIDAVDRELMLITISARHDEMEANNVIIRANQAKVSAHMDTWRKNILHWWGDEKLIKQSEELMTRNRGLLKACDIDIAVLEVN
jgi:hypothetical protein